MQQGDQTSFLLRALPAQGTDTQRDLVILLTPSQIPSRRKFSLVLSGWASAVAELCGGSCVGQGMKHCGMGRQGGVAGTGEFYVSHQGLLPSTQP